jgi:hypothetical protein
LDRSHSRSAFILGIAPICRNEESGDNVRISLARKRTCGGAADSSSGSDRLRSIGESVSSQKVSQEPIRHSAETSGSTVERASPFSTTRRRRRVCLLLISMLSSPSFVRTLDLWIGSESARGDEYRQRRDRWGLSAHGTTEVTSQLARQADGHRARNAERHPVSPVYKTKRIPARIGPPGEDSQILEVGAGGRIARRRNGHPTAVPPATGTPNQKRSPGTGSFARKVFGSHVSK